MINRALEVAAVAHREQCRKGSKVPYITHPCAVGLMLARVGAPETVIAAGILHDTLEDTSVTVDFLIQKFGPEVTEIVRGCSEPDKSQVWEVRKEHTIDFLRNAPEGVRMVTCADKINNLRSIREGLDEVGEAVWERFKRGRDKQEWYYWEIFKSITMQDSSKPLGELVNQLKQEIELVFC